MSNLPPHQPTSPQPVLPTPVIIPPTIIHPPTVESDTIYRATYSSIPVWEMEVKQISVMRRCSDNFLNATQLLKVAGIDKGKRTKILEREAFHKEHEKVQGGYGKYQGTWVPFEAGVKLARRYGVENDVRKLLELDPKRAGHILEKPSSSLGLNSKRNLPLNNDNIVSQSKRVYGQKHLNILPNLTKHNNLVRSVTITDPISNSNNNLNQKVNEKLVLPRTLTTPRKRNKRNEQLNESNNSLTNNNNNITPNIEITSRKLDLLLMLVTLLQENEQLNEELIQLPPDLTSQDISISLDKYGNTILHYCASSGKSIALAQMVALGGKITLQNMDGLTSLMMSIRSDSCFKLDSFDLILSLCQVTLTMTDKKNRTILHHCILNPLTNDQSNFYLSSVLSKAKESLLINQFNQLLNYQDINLDTPLHLAARLNKSNLISILLNFNPNLELINKSGLKWLDYLDNNQLKNQYLEFNHNRLSNNNNNKNEDNNNKNEDNNNKNQDNNNKNQDNNNKNQDNDNNNNNNNDDIITIENLNEINDDDDDDKLELEELTNQKEQIQLLLNQLLNNFLTKHHDHTTNLYKKIQQLQNQLKINQSIINELNQTNQAYKSIMGLKNSISNDGKQLVNKPPGNSPNF